jgi:hypothetical protein
VSLAIVLGTGAFLFLTGRTNATNGTNATSATNAQS